MNDPRILLTGNIASPDLRYVKPTHLYNYLKIAVLSNCFRFHLSWSCPDDSSTSAEESTQGKTQSANWRRRGVPQAATRGPVLLRGRSQPSTAN